MTCIKPFKQENQLSYLNKTRETRKKCEPHQQMTTEYQVPDLGRVQTIAVGFKHFDRYLP